MTCDRFESVLPCPVVRSLLDPMPLPRPARLRTRLAVFAVTAAAVLLWRPAGAHLRAASLLMRFSDPSPPSGLRAMGAVAVDESELTVQGHDRAIAARIYAPLGVLDPPGLVLVHGVHRLGINEPRLVRFARAVAAAGVRVLTPEIQELADYRVDPASIDSIGDAAHALRGQVSPERAVGVMGMSFAGGLSLLAAADPRYQRDISFVVAMGAHDDLSRVSRFFATNAIERPDGSSLSLQAHDYGPLVLVYSHVEDFFPVGDVAVARDALRMWLWEQQPEARAKAASLSPPSLAKMERLFDHHLETIHPDLLRELDLHADLMASVSPHGHLATIRAPVFLLHGAADTVIPPSETLWLAEDLPPGVLRHALVSPAISHVELEGDPSAADEWAVVDFMSDVLRQTDALN